MPCLPLSPSTILGAALLLSPLAAAAQALPPATDETPPAVVGWLAEPSGTVWVAPGAGQAWQPAMANQPLQSGEIIATAPDGRAMIEVMSMRAALAPSSELAISEFGAGGLSATETSGEVAFDLTDQPPGARGAIATPRGTVEIVSPGRYEIAAGAENQPTVVTALGGTASIVNGASVQNVASGQTATLFTEPDGMIATSVSRVVPDPLLTSLIASAPPRPQIAPPSEVAEMTGGLSLTAYGTWSDVPQYGTVWFPDVAAGWVPYRDGRWSYVPPWGWTWVDADPWGFAPFHYGRWVEIGPRWGWVPVAPGISISARVPVYAPALVNFFAVGSPGEVDISISAGVLAAGLVGWVPLGPGELYRPPYRVRPTYIRDVNVYNVRNINRINITEITRRHVTIDNFVDRRVLTTVPASVMAEGRPVGPHLHRPPADTLASLRPLPEGVPVRPGPGRVWAKPERMAAVHPPAAHREPEPAHPAAIHRETPPPRHPAAPEPERAAAFHPPEPAHIPVSIHPVAIRPPAPERSRPPAEPSRAMYHPALPTHPAEPYRPPSRSAYHPALPPHQAESYRSMPRPSYARPPEPPRPEPPRREASPIAPSHRVEGPRPVPVRVAPRPEAPPRHEQRAPDQDRRHP